MVLPAAMATTPSLTRTTEPPYSTLALIARWVGEGEEGLIMCLVRIGDVQLAALVRGYKQTLTHLYIHRASHTSTRKEVHRL